MKKYLLLLVLLPLLAFGQEPTKKQEDGLDKKIDKVFGQATGWFVNGIFYQIPFGSVEDELTINLNPKINDIFENNVYKLIYENNTYIIPLWHHEIYYDNFCVKITPDLPYNIEIDENNNIIVYEKLDIKELLNKENIDIFIGNKHIKLEVNKIKIKKNQNIILYKQGIAKIDNSNVYNISNVSNIIIKLNLI